jgi:hypothetical protein
MTVVAGDYVVGAKIITAKKSTSAAIAKGDLVQCDTTNHVFITCPATINQVGPFGVAAEAQATADTFVKVIIEGSAYVTAGGVIHAPHYVANDTGTAGRVIEYISDVSTAALGGINATKIVGMYEGHENEGSTASLPTDTVSTDIIRIRLGTTG